MNSVIEKLAEIEAAAEAVVERAGEQKARIERELQEERDAFDRDASARTQEKIDRIRRESEEKMEALLASQREKNWSAIENVEREYADNHSSYADMILHNIIEV